MDERLRAYYENTAASYEAFRNWDERYHHFSASILLGLAGDLGIGSLLDVGAGTGTFLRRVKQERPRWKICGIEPVDGLRKVGHEAGLSEMELQNGNALALPFQNGEFDVVTAFALMHHLPEPKQALEEMLRVAKIGVFISDCHNRAQGTATQRRLKRLFHSLHLWRPVNWLKNGGRGHIESEEDGISFSYSLMDDYQTLRNRLPRVHYFSISNLGGTPDGKVLRARERHPDDENGHAAIFAVKNEWS